MRPAAALAASALAAHAGLAGCASASSPRPLVDSLEAEGVLVTDAAPLVLDATMRSWAREATRESDPHERRLETLLVALIRRPEAPLIYRPGATEPIAEIWRTGRANCLGFTSLFVALAREIGLDVYYLRVREIGGLEREGDLVVLSDHVTAAFGPATSRRILDFSDRPIRRYVALERLSDRTALALFYSNRGAEAIRAGEIELARERLERAARIDPRLADGWVNLGVARRRSGDPSGAEAAYRRALDVDPEQASALHNLTTLLDASGRGEEATELFDRAVRRGRNQPWAALALGQIARRRGHLEQAETLFRRAARRLPESAEPWAALAGLALERGDLASARRFAARALDRDGGHAGARAILERLEPGASP